MKRRYRSLAATPIAMLVASVCLAQAPPEQPIAAKQVKFLGSCYSQGQSQDFARYWNKVTPQNAGKWGSRGTHARRDGVERAG